MAITLVNTSVSANNPCSITTPTPGNMLILQWATDGTAKTVPAGWNLIQQRSTESTPWRYGGQAWRVADGTETTVDVTGGDSSARRIVVFEYSGLEATGPVHSDYRQSQTNGGNGPWVDITPTAGKDALVIGAATLHAFAGETLTPRAGFTAVDPATTYVINSPNMGIQMLAQIVSGASGSYRLGSTYTGSRYEMAFGAAFVETLETGDIVQIHRGGVAALGNTLVLFQCGRETGGNMGDQSDPDWQRTPQGAFAANSDGAGVWWRRTKAADLTAVSVSGGGEVWIVELKGGLSILSSGELVSSGASIVGPALSVPDLTSVVMGFVVHSAGESGPNIFTPGSGWTELFDARHQDGHPQQTGLYRKLVGAAGSYAPETTGNGGNWGIQSIALVEPGLNRSQAVVVM